MSSVGGSGGSGGADSASRAESARAEAARADAARQAEASRKAAEEAAQAQAVKAQVAQNPFTKDTFTAAVARAPVELNPSPVSVTAAQPQQVAQLDVARQAEVTQTAEAEATAETAQAAETTQAAEADATAEATEADAAAEAQAAQEPTVTEEDVEAALQDLPDVELARVASEADQTPEMVAQTQQMQTALREMGYVAAAHVTGFFGSITEGALKSYQYENGMTVTGAYDAATRTAMADSLAEKRAAEAQGITEPAVDLPETYTAVTDEQLADIMPNATAELRETYLGPLNTAMEEFNISTPERQAAFLSQVAAETADLQFMSELAPNPEHGSYYGRGTLQLTHETNYQQAGAALGEDLTRNPGQVATDPELAARTGGWYFNDRGLNEQADRGRIGAVTLGVNGGYNGIDRRLEAYDTARDVLGD